MYRHRLQKSRVNPTFALACAAVNNCHVPIGNMRFTSEAELLKIQKCFLGENLEQFIFFCSVSYFYVVPLIWPCGWHSNL